MYNQLVTSIINKPGFTESSESFGEETTFANENFTDEEEYFYPYSKNENENLQASENEFERENIMHDEHYTDEDSAFYKKALNETTIANNETESENNFAAVSADSENEPEAPSEFFEQEFNNELKSYPQVTPRFANAYLTLSGQKQGQIKGSVIQKGREGAIAVYKLHHQVLSPRDGATGAATGKRIHKPLVIIKEIDIASPKLLNALLTNEIIKQVIINFFQAVGRGARGGAGAEVNYYRITLTNAVITDISQDLPDILNPVENKFPFLERVEFVYQKIEWNWLDGTAVSAMDDWASQRV